mgnify:CR=1 FL=1
MNFPDLPADFSEAAILFEFDDVKFDLPNDIKLAGWLASLADQERKSMRALTFIFCSDERLRAINAQYPDHDNFTHVITFPYSEDAIHGDIFISADRVRDNAAIQSVSFEHELLRVMAHGVLHLAGYEDKTPEKKAIMSEKEDFYLKQSPFF